MYLYDHVNWSMLSLPCFVCHGMQQIYECLQHYLGKRPAPVTLQARALSREVRLYAQFIALLSHTK